MNLKYKRGFTIFDDNDRRKEFPTEWIQDEKKSTEIELYLLAYDANLWPTPDINTWKPNNIKEACEKICERIKDFEGNVYLAGFLLDRVKCELIL